MTSLWKEIGPRASSNKRAEIVLFLLSSFEMITHPKALLFNNFCQYNMERRANI